MCKRLFLLDNFLLSSAPYDQYKSILGFIEYYLCIIVVALRVVHPFTACLALYVGQSFYIDAFCKDFKCLGDKMDGEISGKKPLDRAILEILKFAEDIIRCLIINHFCSLKLFDSFILRFFNNFSEMVNGIVFFQMFCSVLYISSAIYQLDHVIIDRKVFIQQKLLIRLFLLLDSIFNSLI